MLCDDIRATIQPLLRSIAAASEGWTLAICSPDRMWLTASALLLERCTLIARSIAEFLTLPLPQQGRLLLLCDDQCADGGADDLIAQLRSLLGPERCRVVVCLAADVPQERLESLWRCGMDGICSRAAGREGALLQTILMVLRGQSCLDPLFRERLRTPSAVLGAEGRAVQLTGREQELIVAVARGYTSRQIAVLQQLRSDTVRHRLSQLYRKVGVPNQRGLIAWGLDHGVIRRPDLGAALPPPDGVPLPAWRSTGNWRPNH
ncbi:LuxR C-terminal-related transcriptional regulator [Synechococcus sp. CS-1328]|uniref:helix-turn-helix transcriptional regulator n=1 Tax=Synechococcus sp. CS-1328 TaxID=2847976 RepID=UPI00223B5548|nr:LuxR C-terminal-related transcriptional regulator [Synechococcus sp. CS-1328]MCT0225595.1 LuxR C-terminal-related transcriptional regulator [Synechococcus sp. CS-1328]